MAEENGNENGNGNGEEETPISPLFVSNTESLRARLRLTGAAAGDALAIIDQAILKVRIGFYSRLPEFRIAALLETESVPNPSNKAEILRCLAEQTEVAWVRHTLMQELPTLFIDGSGSTQHIWNQEGMTREIRPAEKDEMLRRLWNSIVSAIEQLGRDVLDPSTTTASTIGPDKKQPRPGATIGLDWSRPGD